MKKHSEQKNFKLKWTVAKPVKIIETRLKVKLELTRLWNDFKQVLPFQFVSFKKVAPTTPSRQG